MTIPEARCAAGRFGARDLKGRAPAQYQVFTFTSVTVYDIFYGIKATAAIARGRFKAPKD